MPMPTKWRTLLAKHEGKTLVEFCRRPKIKERIAGFIVGFSPELILIHRLDWNTFVLDGYSVLRNSDVIQCRPFSRSSYWQVKAVKAFRLRPRRLSKIKITDWPETIGSIGKQFPIIHVVREMKFPGECWIGAPTEGSSRETVIENLDPDAKWTGPYRMKTRDVTRVDFGGGYERALALTAPKRKMRRSQTAPSLVLRSKEIREPA